MTMKNAVLALVPPYFRKYTDRIESSPLGYRLARGAFWSLVGAVIARGLGLASSILVARILGKSGFGELGIIQSTVGMFGTFAGFGLGITATKFIAEYRATNPARAGRIRGLSSAFAWITSATTSIILFFMAPWLAEHTLAAPHLAGLLRIGTILLFLTSINGAQTGALSGFEAFKTVARINLSCGLLNFPLMVGGVYLAGIPGAVWGMVIATGSNWLLNHIAIRKECLSAGIPYTYQGCWSEKKILWKFSLPSVLAGTMTGPIMWGVNAILVNGPDGYAGFGLVNVANQWRTVLMALPMIFCNVALPILSAEQGNRDDTSGFGRVMKISQGLAIWTVIPLTTCILFLGDWVMYLYGEDFTDGVLILIGVVLGTAISAIGNIIGSGITAKGKIWFGTLQNITWGAVLILIVWIGAPLIGAKAYACGFPIAHLVLSVWSCFYLKKYFPSDIFIRTLFAISFLSFLAVAAALVSQYLRLWLFLPFLGGSIIMCTKLAKIPLRRVFGRNISERFSSAE